MPLKNKAEWEKLWKGYYLHLNQLDIFILDLFRLDPKLTQTKSGFGKTLNEKLLADGYREQDIQRECNKFKTTSFNDSVNKLICLGFVKMNRPANERGRKGVTYSLNNEDQLKAWHHFFQHILKNKTDKKGGE